MEPSRTEQTETSRQLISQSEEKLETGLLLNFITSKGTAILKLLHSKPLLECLPYSEMVDPVLIDWPSALCFKDGWGFSQNADKAQDEMWTLSEYYSQPRYRHFPIAYQQRSNFARPVGNMALTLSIASELSISRVIVFQWGFWQRSACLNGKNTRYFTIQSMNLRQL